MSADVPGGPRPVSTILVVDDDAAVRGIIRQLLTTAGYRVLEAENGKQAMKHIEDSAADIVLTDLAMPEQDGLDTIMALRHRPSRPKIIAMSGAFDGTLLPIAKLLGGDACLKKPFTADELLRVIGEVLQ